MGRSNYIMSKISFKEWKGGIILRKRIAEREQQLNFQFHYKGEVSITS